MQVFDASSMINAWDFYPIHPFPALWDWIADEICTQDLVMPTVAFLEVKKKTPECAKWLKDNNVVLLEPDEAIIGEALRIKRLLGVANDKYHPKGVGENDLIIIATARVHNGELVSDERRQTIVPQEASKRKIPAVCALSEVSVPCISFIEFIKRSGKVFR
jgi:predicted nucleic acid-binding protein